MYHKVLKGNLAVKEGQYIAVHEDQLDDLVDRGLVEEKGHKKDPSEKEDKKEESKPEVTSKGSIVENTEKVKK